MPIILIPCSLTKKIYFYHSGPTNNNCVSVYQQKESNGRDTNLMNTWYFVCLVNNLTWHPGGGGGHLYFRLDIIRVKGLSKHTLNTYFSGMKIDPKYAFCMRFSQFERHVHSKICQYDQKHTLFSNFAGFCTPKRCTRVHCLVLKNNPNYVNFFTRMISNFRYKWPPPGMTLILIY